jgi:CRISPR/Cas system-associated protein endoribonuclease Cas2
MSDKIYTVVEELKKENAALRQALKQARKFWLSLGYTTRHFSEIVKVSATQLSAWTDEIPTREPDFKD